MDADESVHASQYNMMDADFYTSAFFFIVG